MIRLEHSSNVVPAGIRCLLAFAGLLLPPSLRSEWLREWHAEFWHSISCGDPRGRLWGRASGALLDAWTILRDQYGISTRLQDASHSRSGPVIVVALLLAVTALVTNGFSRGRRLLFGDDSAGLILIAQPVPFMGGSSRISSAQAEAWLREAQTVAESGRWSASDRQNASDCRADVSAKRLLSIAPDSPCVRIDSLGSTQLTFAGIVARLRNGASLREAQAELARTTAMQKGWACPRIVSLSDIRRAPLVPVGLAIVTFLFMSFRAIRVHTVRASIWAVAKIVCSFALIGGVWLDLAARAPFAETAIIPLGWTVSLYLLPLVFGGWLARYFRRDASRHCRICYRPLTMPVSVGMFGRRLFEPSGVEYLCGAGHGVLVVGPVNEDRGEEVWATWSDSWA